MGPPRAGRARQAQSPRPRAVQRESRRPRSLGWAGPLPAEAWRGQLLSCLGDRTTDLRHGASSSDVRCRVFAFGRWRAQSLAGLLRAFVRPQQPSLSLSLPRSSRHIPIALALQAHESWLTGALGGSQRVSVARVGAGASHLLTANLHPLRALGGEGGQRGAGVQAEPRALRAPPGSAGGD